MDELTLFSRFGLALAIGLLIGLQREYSQREGEPFAGARTFALISLLGCGAALIGKGMASPWPFAVVFLLVGVLVAAGYLVGARAGRVGLTTEMAALITFLAGALCLLGYLSLAAALGVVTAVLLSLKLEVRELVSRLSREDVYATLKFAVITAIVLPLLPGRTYGPPPLDVLSPRNVWLMVVFISGISFLGYVLIKLVGPRRGIGLTGLLGGLVSSTAVTLSFSERSRKAPSLSRALALAISLSWTVMFVRVLIEAAVVGGRLVTVLWPPIIASGTVGLLYCTFLLLSERPAGQEEVELAAPFELGPAIKFGLLYALILVSSKAAQMYLGDAGVYLASVVSGVADVDAITLSMARLSAAGDLPLSTAARAVVLAAMANTAVKGGIVLALGAPGLRRAVLPGLLAMLATGVGLAFLI